MDNTFETSIRIVLDKFSPSAKDALLIKLQEDKEFREWKAQSERAKHPFLNAAAQLPDDIEKFLQELPVEAYAHLSNTIAQKSKQHG